MKILKSQIYMIELNKQTFELKINKNNIGI